MADGSAAVKRAPPELERPAPGGLARGGGGCSASRTGPPARASPGDASARLSPRERRRIDDRGPGRAPRSGAPPLRARPPDRPRAGPGPPRRGPDPPRGALRPAARPPGRSRCRRADGHDRRPARRTPRRRSRPARPPRAAGRPARLAPPRPRLVPGRPAAPAPRPARPAPDRPPRVPGRRAPGLCRLRHPGRPRERRRGLRRRDGGDGRLAAGGDAAASRAEPRPRGDVGPDGDPVANADRDAECRADQHPRPRRRLGGRPQDVPDRHDDRRLARPRRRDRLAPLVPARPRRRPPPRGRAVHRQGQLAARLCAAKPGGVPGVQRWRPRRPDGGHGRDDRAPDRLLRPGQHGRVRGRRRRPGRDRGERRPGILRPVLRRVRLHARLRHQRRPPSPQRQPGAGVRPRAQGRRRVGPDAPGTPAGGPLRNPRPCRERRLPERPGGLPEGHEPDRGDERPPRPRGDPGRLCQDGRPVADVPLRRLRPPAHPARVRRAGLHLHRRLRGHPGPGRRALPRGGHAAG